MMQTQIRNLILRGWRPQDIAHATGQWPPPCTTAPPNVPPGVLDAWISHPTSAFPPRLECTLFDAPLLKPHATAASPALRRIRALAHHAHHASNEAEARAFRAKAHTLCKRYRLPTVARSVPGPSPDPRFLMAQRIHIAQPQQLAHGVLLRQIALATGAMAMQLHRSGIWTLIGDLRAIDQARREYLQIVRCPWPSMNGMDPIIASNVLLGAARHHSEGMNPTPPQPFNLSREAPSGPPAWQLAIVEALVLHDIVDPSPPEISAWQAVGARWYAAHRRMPRKLVELQP